MTKLIGRKFNVGIGKESTRGTAVAADYWLPKMDFSHGDKISEVVHESSIGTIHDAENSHIVEKFSEGKLKGRIADTSFGLILEAVFGGDVATLVATGVYDHVFSVLESAQHPSLTVDISEPNASTGIRYALSMIDSLEVTFEIKAYGQYEISFRGNKNVAGANTASFTVENIFLPQHASVKFATNLAGLAGASAISVKKATIKISKNIEDDQVIGTLDAIDRLNKQFSVEGSVELTYEDRSYIDTIMLGGLSKAMRIAFTNSDVTIGVGSNPTITFDMASVRLSEVARTISNDDIVKQTLNFKAYYSIADTQMIKATLRNTKTTAY
jgi:hypothetical protein